MPESKSEQTLHRNEEITNFLICGDARGPRWLATHPADRARAMGSIADRDPRALPDGMIVSTDLG